MDVECLFHTLIRCSDGCGVSFTRSLGVLMDVGCLFHTLIRCIDGCGVSLSHAH